MTRITKMKNPLLLICERKMTAPSGQFIALQAFDALKRHFRLRYTLKESN